MPGCANFSPEPLQGGSANGPDAALAARRNVIVGTAVSSGIAIGRSQFVNRRGNTTVSRRRIPAKDIEFETSRLEKAVESLVAEFTEAKSKIGSAGPDGRAQADIIDVYIMICSDPKLLGLARDNIREKRIGAGWAWEKAVQATLEIFRSIDSPYMRERAADVQAVASRVIKHLHGRSGGPDFAPGEQLVFFAHDLTPADTLALAPERIIALATEMGGKTSHTGILARSLHIPCVVGCTGIEEVVRDGELVIVDGLEGIVVVNPHEAELAEYRRKQATFSAYEERIRVRASYPAETEDGVRIAVYGNLESCGEVESLKNSGGEGVGLYRTEFGFLSRQDMPEEDELFEDYRKVIEAMSPRGVVLRTLDAGADKMIGQRQKLEEDNPALGLRAIRYCLRHQDIFRRQLRAMLRAGAYGNASIMFPMISGLGELRMAKSILTEVKQELDNEGVIFNRDIPIGTMIELPAAVLVASTLAREVNFFSIGTNDLIQYSLGIDRGNKYVSYLYQPLHPAIIMSVKHVVDMAHQAGITVCVCGEMASDPYCLPVLLGMGIDELSMAPQMIPLVKSLIRRSNTEEFRTLLRQVFKLGSAEAIIRQIRQNVYNRFEDELTFFTSMTGTNI